MGIAFDLPPLQLLSPRKLAAKDDGASAGNPEAGDNAAAATFADVLAAMAAADATADGVPDARAADPRIDPRADDEPIVDSDVSAWQTDLVPAPQLRAEPPVLRPERGDDEASLRPTEPVTDLPSSALMPMVAAEANLPIVPTVLGPATPPPAAGPVIALALARNATPSRLADVVPRGAGEFPSTAPDAQPPAEPAPDFATARSSEPAPAPARTNSRAAAERNDDDNFAPAMQLRTGSAIPIEVRALPHERAPEREAAIGAAAVEAPAASAFTALATAIADASLVDRPRKAVLHASTAVGSPAWAEEMSGKVVQMVMLRNESAELHVRPGHLGPIDIQINVSGGEATVQLIAAQAATRDALEAALPVLRDLLAEQGLTLGETAIGSRARDEPAPGGTAPRTARAERDAAARTAIALPLRSARLLDVFA